MKVHVAVELLTIVKNYICEGFFFPLNKLLKGKLLKNSTKLQHNFCFIVVENVSKCCYISNAYMNF